MGGKCELFSGKPLQPNRLWALGQPNPDPDHDSLSISLSPFYWWRGNADEEAVSRMNHSAFILWKKKKNLKVAKLWESPKWHIQHSPHKSQSASCPVITLLLCPVALTLYCYPSSPSTWLYHSSGQASHVTLLTALWLSLFCRGVTADLYDPNNGLSSLFTIPLPLPPSALIPLDWKSPCDLPQCVAA